MKILKTASSLMILLLGVNLAVAGLAVGLCTGQPDCIYCTSGSTPHPHDKPADHGCNPSEPLADPCDFESNGTPAVYFLALSSEAGFREILSFQEWAAAASERISPESNPKQFFHWASAALFHRTNPLYILFLTLLR